MKENWYDVLIIGAGASGLMAALELVQTGKKIAIVEARNRVGGRIHTASDNRFSIPLEMGAEFVHGNLELTQLLLKKANAKYFRLSGDMWQSEKGRLQKQEDFIEDYSELEKKFKELKEDIPVAEFIKQSLQGKPYEDLRTTLQNYVEGYYAADTARASTKALCEELATSDDEQYRIDGGYKSLVDYLCREAEQKGCFFFLSQPVEKIYWSENAADVKTVSHTFSATKVLITVPLGILQSEQILFSPAIDEKINAAQQLGFGPVIKTILQFKNAFWKNTDFTGNHDLDHLSFLFSKEEVPTWWTQYPKDVALLTGWLGGPNAEAVKHHNEEEILNKALGSLQSIFNVDLSYLRQHIQAACVANWATDPYNRGGYAYEVVNGPAIRKTLKEPEANTLFFAGEALYDGPEIGTVEAALVSGRDTAHRIIASF
ncbi:MAG TPA: NAD(P)/FAD-dependent oxidoreductase [Flavisolibacter sp.]|nr:NAD(P)/FAD-dependent oxidoreductase [Flavisolibacter sp.]